MRAALFDLDNTLLDRVGSLRDFAGWQAAKMLNLNVDDQSRFVHRFVTLDQNGRVWKDKVYQSLIDEFNIKHWSVDELLDAYLLTFCAFCKPRNGAHAAISEFRDNNFKIGLVTNGKSPFQERNFRALDFENLFDCVVVSEAVEYRKPDREIFELACQTLDADIQASLFIGDNPVADIQGAKNAGMTTIYVPMEEHSDFCAHADHTYTSLSDISGYFERLRYMETTTD